MAGKDALSDKQWAFVREYLVDKNATQAAIRAGYSAKTAQEQSSRLLSNVMVKAAVEEGLKILAEKTETEAEWVRRRLREEATDYSDFASHSARIRALELLGKINGVFERDNKQKADGLAELLTSLPGAIMSVSRVLNAADDGAD
jgi:phage terminase small subunit